jgi:amino acid adenylation domain-containing protein
MSDSLSERSALEERLLRAARGRRAVPRTDTVRDGDRRPALPAQSRLFFLHRLEPAAERSYRITAALELTGDLDEAALRQAVNAVVRRHTVLRTVLRLDGGRVWQEVRPPGPAYALRTAPTASTVDEALADLTGRPFDLSEGPLVRSTLFPLGPSRHLLVCELHHAVADAWSIPILCGELGAAYGNARSGETTRVDALPLPVPAASSARDWAYWKRVLEGAPRTLTLPADFVRLSRRRHHGARIVRHLGPGVMDGLRGAGPTAAAVALAVFAIVLHRWTGDAEVVIGAPAAARLRPEDQNTIGLYATTLPIRLDLSDDPSFATVTGRVASRLLEALAHQDPPLEELAAAAGQAGTTDRNPLYQVLFAMQTIPGGDPDFPGLSVRSVTAPTAGAKLDLSVHLTPAGHGLRLTVEYDADLFEPATADALADQIAYALSAWPAVATERAGDLLLAPPSGEAALIRSSAGPDHPAGVPLVVDAIAAQATRTPLLAALRMGDECLTYQDLMARANAIASRLRTRGRESLVAVLLPRSFDLIAVLIGVHRAGAAYVPLDPRWPRARIAALIDACHPDAVITNAAAVGGLPAGPEIVDIAELPTTAAFSPAGVDADDLAYVVCTSGSTGTPKSVMVTHGGLANHLAWAGELFADGGGLLHSSVGFDLPVPLLFGPLMRGRTLTLAREPAAAALAGAEEAVEGGFGFLKMTPSHLRALAAEIGWPALARSTRRLMIAGEDLGGELLRPLAEAAPTLALLNEYGPSEVSVACSAYAGRAADFARHRAVPIGPALPGTRVYVLDRRLRPVPPGVIGEIYIAGAGVARGYLGDPRQTADRFRPDLYAAAPGTRMYRTGDLARRTPDGSVTFAGRADAQIKIRGVRVEPAEIEATVRSYPGVTEAAVVAVGNPPDRIEAYIVASGVTADQVAAFLRRRLPEQLVPARIVEVDRLPLNDNGKLDRSALAMAPSGPARPEQPSAAVVATPTQQALARLWQAVLGGDLPRPADNFFDCGGHSLAAVALVERIDKSFGVPCPLSAVFGDPTLADLASTVERMVREKVTALSQREVEAALAEGARHGLHG